ncbi:hypothetical protein BC835DRAFT_1310267 [Cytidiella melzeri]|nr:hypothetical protein BC835DRAFT_1310267 [Cytidiella melzeri]
MTLLTSIRLFFASLLLQSPLPEVEETIDTTVQKAECDLESCMPPTINDNHSFHSRDVSIPQGDVIEPNLHKALEENASQLPTRTMLNSYVFPSYPLTLYLAKKPEKAIQTVDSLKSPTQSELCIPPTGRGREGQKGQPDGPTDMGKALKQGTTPPRYVASPKTGEPEQNNPGPVPATVPLLCQDPLGPTRGVPGLRRCYTGEGDSNKTDVTQFPF